MAWEDRGYRIMLREDSRMDIPEDMRLTSQYRATLAHKVTAVTLLIKTYNSSRISFPLDAAA